ncbi:MAG: sulfurtransferase [Gammaproteobacteria bacterium]
MYQTLIEAETLRRNLDVPDWRVFDCRCSPADPAAGRKAWLTGHIPGARHADLDRVLAAAPSATTGRHPLPARETLTNWFASEGVDAKTQVVAYDDVGGAFAARLWWLMRWLGHEAVAVLDGGLSAWRENGGEIESGETSAPEPADFQAGEPSVKFLRAEETLAIVRGEAPGVLSDARAAPRYRGETEPLDPVAGHIPGARNFPYAGNLDEQGHFLGTKDLRERFAALAADNPARVVHYCGSGVTACHNLLAMEHAGLAGSRLYAGSWSEWIRDPARPVARGEEE